MEKKISNGEATLEEPEDSVWGKLLRVLRFAIYIAALFLILTSQDNKSLWAFLSYVIGSIWVVSLVVTAILPATTSLEKTFAVMEILFVITILWAPTSLNLDRFSMMITVFAYNIALLIGRIKKTKS